MHNVIINIIRAYSRHEGTGRSKVRATFLSSAACTQTSQVSRLKAPSHDLTPCRPQTHTLARSAQLQVYFAPINTAMVTGGAGTHLQTHTACALFRVYVHMHASPLQQVNCTHVINMFMMPKLTNCTFLMKGRRMRQVHQSVLKLVLVVTKPNSRLNGRRLGRSFRR